MGDYNRDIRIECLVQYKDNNDVFYEITSYGSLRRLDLRLIPINFRKMKPFEYVYLSSKEVENILSEENPYFKYLHANESFERHFNPEYNTSHKVSSEEQRILNEKYFRKD